MGIPLKPKIGTKLYFTCIRCDSEGFRQVKGVKKNAENSDGSTCYTIKFLCADCGYLNGDLKPIWYNLYSSGEIVGYGFDYEKTCELYASR